MEITEKLKESVEKGKFGCGIFIDLRKAFDTVNHSILLKNWNIMVSREYFSSGLDLT